MNFFTTNMRMCSNWNKIVARNDIFGSSCKNYKIGCCLKHFDLLFATIIILFFFIDQYMYLF
jgi:hypothetical protein